MSNFIKYYIKYYVLWVAYFLLVRAVFLVYESDKTSQLDASSIAKTFLYGSRLDLSMAGYYSVIPFLLLAIREIFHLNGKISTLLKGYTYLMILLSSFFVSADLELYKNWGFRLDEIALNTLKDPAESMASAGSSPLGYLICIMLILTFFTATLFKRYVFDPIAKNHNELKDIHPLSTRTFRGVLGILCMFILIIPIRGGFQLAPINQSAVYFSQNTFANHAAINAVWNFWITVYEKKSNNYRPVEYFDDTKANNLLADLFKDTSATQYLIRKEVKNPNVILITWESFTGKAVERLGGVKGVTPQFDALCKEGIFFDSIYAAGHRTHFGLMATLGGYPTMTGFNIFDTPRKAAQLPCLAKDFSKKGYETSFYYGGEAEFANFKNYLVTGQFSRLVTKEVFDPKDLSSKWGAFDHVLLRRAMSDLKQAKEPFFSNILTLSSHEPFELPNEAGWGMPNFKPTTDVDLMFQNVLYYTDQTIGEFFTEAKKQPWWNNTIVVIIADHGSPHIQPYDNEFRNFHIPMLWLGGALAVRDTTIHTVGSQTDVAATLLGQLDMPHQEYQWSKNITTKGYRPFAYFNFHHGFGFVKKDGQYVFDTEGGYIRRQIGKVDSADIEKGKAYIQMTYKDYLGK